MIPLPKHSHQRRRRRSKTTSIMLLADGDLSSAIVLDGNGLAKWLNYGQNDWND